MKISYQWLQEYVKHTLTAQELAERFRLTSSEVDSIENRGEKYDKLIIGKVTRVQKHPNADKLQLATVQIGKDTKHIVCGAPNLALNQTVVVALPGVTLYPSKGAPFTIQKTTIRGEVSEGMLCSVDELGLPYSVSEDGIFILPNDLSSGTPLSDALGLTDQVLDIEITPNRPDLLSYLGLAREVTAFEKRSLLNPAIYSFDEQESKASLAVEAVIDDSSICRRFSTVCMDNVSIQPSPLWLQTKLILSGIKPINCVVDVTNYVMLELGQPLHAFDYDKLTGSPTRKKLIVRTARAGEKLEVLDHTIRQLEKGDIVISNAEDVPIDLAGMMGGLSSSISPTTTRIMFEAATFSGSAIRRTSRHLGLRTEASSRFEKGLDPELTITALKRAVYLLTQISEAKVASSLFDLYPRSRQEKSRIHLSFAQIQQVTGVHISAAECKSILQKLGFQLPSVTKSSFEAIPPSWRQDISLPEDVIEELIRIWGYDRLPSTIPQGIIKAPQPNTYFERKMKLRHALASQGMHETIHLSLTSKHLIQKSGISLNEALRITLPLSEEGEYLLPSHLITFLQNNASQNLYQGELDLFEIGHVFRPPHREEEVLSWLLRSTDSFEALIRKAKALLQYLVQVLGIEGELSYSPASNPPTYGLPKGSLTVMLGGKTLGTFSLVDPHVVEGYKIRIGKNLLFAEFNLPDLLGLVNKARPYQPLPQFPSVERDLTLIIDRALAVQGIIDLLTKEQEVAILNHWVITDIYTGKPLNKNQKSVTIHFVYNGIDRTLEDSEVNKDQERLSKLLRKHLSAQIT